MRLIVRTRIIHQRNVVEASVGGTQNLDNLNYRQKIAVK